MPNDFWVCFIRSASFFSPNFGRTTIVRLVFKCVLYLALYGNSSWPVVQVPCPSVTGRFYKNSVLKKVKEFYNKKRPSKEWSGVHLFNDNASSHKCEVVKSFLASEKV